MPTYSYKCSDGHVADVRDVPFERRMEVRDCLKCGRLAQYQFPTQAILGFQPFEEYFDEGLNADIKGRRHRKEVMNILGVHEAGDAVHGARNFDPKSPVHIKPLPPQGVDVSHPEERPLEPWDVSLENSRGEFSPVDMDNAPGV